MRAATANNTSDSVFGACVSCDDCVPLAWRVRATPLTEGELYRLQEQTLRSLRAEPSDAAEQKEPEMQRMHEKLDALMEAVGRLLSIHQPAPVARNVKLSRRGVAWFMPAQEAAPSPGEIGVLELHLYPRLLQPLLLPARVTSVVSSAGESRVEMSFEPICELVESAIERHVFRRHRRAIAESRKHG
jgi:hypothetical protein